MMRSIQEKEVKGNERSVIKVTHATARDHMNDSIGNFIPFDAFYNACSLNYKGYRNDIQVLLNNGWKVTKETVKNARTKPQSLFLTLLYLKMYGFAYFVNKYGLKRNYH